MADAVSSWRRQFDEWVIPQELLDAVPDSPYTWPQGLWRRKAESAVERGEITPTRQKVIALAGPGGSVLDIGAGTGRASLPMARVGHRVTAVERNDGMLEGLRDLSIGLPVKIVEGSWPEVAAQVDVHDVAMCAHVVYDVADIGPFLFALNKAAKKGVVIELTESHPWTSLGPYYQALHQLDRPAGPTVDDLMAVISESLHVVPEVDRWERPSDLWHESEEELLEFYRRRLVLPIERRAELARLLAPDIVEVDGRFVVGDVRPFATMWWRQPD
jgi:SAM-dependent methyltransferase